jgi:hypothetical protein
MFGIRRQGDYLANPQGSSTDPFFSSVVLLVKANGTNGATSFADSSSYAKTQSSVQSTTIDTSNSKYGSGGLKHAPVNSGSSGSGNGAWVRYPANGSDFQFDVGTYCFDWWMKVPLNAFANNPSGYDANVTYAGSSECGNITFATDRVSIYLGYQSTTQPYMALTKVDDGAWHHYAIQRTSPNNQMRMWYDGVEKTVTGLTALSSNGAPFTLEIGRSNVGSYFPGGYWIDDFRVTRAVRYTTNFTPSEAPTQ